MRYTGLWFTLAASYSARQGAGLALVYPSGPLQYHISILEVPTPLGLLSPMRGIAVSPVWVPWVSRDGSDC